jgi:hypothetical protein
MKTGIIAFAIAVALMATVQTAMAGQFTCQGNVTYENGTEFPHGATLQMWNLDHPEYMGQPWTTTTQPVPPPTWHLDYQKSGEYGSTDDHIKVGVTSPDGNYVGVNISRWGDVQVGTLTNVHMDITMHLQTPSTDTFTMSLPLGWNLISLPLTPLDSSTGAVLGNATIVYDAVQQYDATTKTFADATTMAPGTGYFVHVTTAGDWVYEGTAVDSTSPGLTAGLNMIGVPNCTMSVGDAMGSADYRYVARWDADDQKYEVYNPSAPDVFHGFTTMTAGEGYFVSAKSEDAGWTVSCS